MKIWIMKELDEYEFPILIADSAAELARIAGVSESSVYCGAWRIKNGRGRSQFEMAEVDDEDKENN